MRGIPLVTHKYIPIVVKSQKSQPKPQTKPSEPEKQKATSKPDITEPQTPLTSEPKLEEPPAILITPQNQGEE